MMPIPASQFALHSPTLAAQWWTKPSLFPPSVARGLKLLEPSRRRKGQLQVGGAQVRVAAQPQGAQLRAVPQQLAHTARQRSRTP